MEENSLWRNIISLKYGMEDRGWFSNTPRGRYLEGYSQRSDTNEAELFD